MKTRILLICLVLFIAGCAVVPSAKSPSTISLYLQTTIAFLKNNKEENIAGMQALEDRYGVPVVEPATTWFHATEEFAKAMIDLKNAMQHSRAIISDDLFYQQLLELEHIFYGETLP